MKQPTKQSKQNFVTTENPVDTIPFFAVVEGQDPRKALEWSSVALSAARTIVYSHEGESDADVMFGAGCLIDMAKAVVDSVSGSFIDQASVPAKE